MSKVGISCGFRHDPAKGKFIPAAVTADSGSRSPYAGKVLPVIGWVCLAADDGRVFWSAVKYDAPWVWPKGSANEAQSHGAWIGTTRLASFDCHDCHTKMKFVSCGGKKRPLCPSCGSDSVDSELIKDGSPEFMAMLGDLKGPLESLAKGALAETPQATFHFPSVVAGGKNLELDQSLPPWALGAAQARERGLKSLASMADLDELRRIEEWDLSILPEPTWGVAEYDDLRNGLDWDDGLVHGRLKPWLPPPKAVPISPSVFTY